MAVMRNRGAINLAGRRPEDRAEPDDMTKTRSTMWRVRSAGAVVLVALGLAVGARAQTIYLSAAPHAVASNGAVVVMPDFAQLDCDEMSKILHRIDLSDYRGPEPVDEDHPDWPIFDYEDQLTKRLYFSCTLGENQFEDPGAAFSFGFELQ